MFVLLLLTITIQTKAGTSRLFCNNAGIFLVILYTNTGCDPHYNRLARMVYTVES